jgi:hypothetical protein
MGGNKGHLPLETPGKNRGFSCKSRVMMDKIIGSSSIKYMCNLPKKKINKTILFAEIVFIKNS